MIFGALGLGFCLSLFVSQEILNFIIKPAGQLVFLQPAGALMAQLKVALLNGIVVSLPVVLWQAGLFVWSGLYAAERKQLLLFLCSLFCLFCLGLAFGYFVLVRIGYRVLLSFASEQLQPLISVETYLAFVLNTILICGILFLLPMILVYLAKFGLIKADFLRKQRSKVIVGLSILVALITPTVDLLSMLLVLLPVIMLFEVGIWLVSWSEREQKFSTKNNGKNRENFPEM